jgi:hypothetical protein
MFYASGSSDYNEHDNLEHGYITTCYLNIDIKNNFYNNSRTQVNNVHTTLVVTTEGKRGDTRRGRG